MFIAAYLLESLGAIIALFIAWPWLLWDKRSSGPGVALAISVVCLALGWLLETVGG